ncbi:MAG TPA: PilZ domain-containing protein [Tepidisphaeraceae bacterium]
MSTDLREQPRDATDWPPEVDLILSALEAGGATDERRRVQRMKYHVKAELRLFSDQPAADPWVLYTRDVNPKGLGFITSHRLPLGYGGKLILPSPTGQPITIHCTLYRCREAAHGWFEGALYFNREQWTFSLQ